MWLYCDHCNQKTADIYLKECSYCSDYFCPSCDPILEAVLCCNVHRDRLIFCSTGCKKDYRQVHWACTVLKVNNGSNINTNG